MNSNFTTYAHAYIHTYMHACILNTCVHENMRACTHIYIRTCMHSQYAHARIVSDASILSIPLCTQTDDGDDDPAHG